MLGSCIIELIIFMGGRNMSDLDLEKEKRDQMDGGFAVVDRERLIEEEVRAVTPWYKHFIHVFTAPTKMMEECFSIEPTKGASIGVVGIILFSAIYMLLNFANPLVKMQTFETLRNAGLDESKLAQTYEVSRISGTIGAIIGAFISVFFTTLLIQIVKAIVKDRCKFGTLFKMVMIATTISYAILCVDALVAILVGVNGSVFSVSFLMSEEMRKGALGATLAGIISLANIISIIYMIMGYRIVTHGTKKKAIMVILIVEIVSIALSYIMTSVSLSMTSSIMG